MSYISTLKDTKYFCTKITINETFPNLLVNLIQVKIGYFYSIGKMMASVKTNIFWKGISKSAGLLLK